MNASSDIRLPFPSRCALCGSELERGSYECPRCFPPGGDPAPRLDLGIEGLLRQARGRMLVGLLVLGPVFWPLAYWSAARARRRYQSEGLADRDLLRRIDRHQAGAVALLVLWLVILLAGGELWTL